MERLTKILPRPATVVCTLCLLGNIAGLSIVLQETYESVYYIHLPVAEPNIADLKGEGTALYDYILWKFLTPLMLLYHTGLDAHAMTTFFLCGPEVVLVRTVLASKLFTTVVTCFWWVWTAVICQKLLVVYLQAVKLFEHVTSSAGTADEITLKQSGKWWLAHLVPNINELVQFNLFVKVPYKLLLFASDLYSCTLIPQLLWRVVHSVTPGAEPTIHPMLCLLFAIVTCIPNCRRPVMKLFCLSSYSGMPWNDMYLYWVDCNIEVACLYLAIANGWGDNKWQSYLITVVGIVSWVQCMRAVSTYVVNYYFMWNLFRNPQMFNMNGGSAATARPNFGLRSSPEESEKAWALLEIDWRTLNHAQLANYMPQYQQLLTRMVDETGLMQKSLKQRSGAPPEPEKNCVVCREAPPELCFAPCGHSTMCLDCHIIWQSLDNRTCPLCKTAVTDTFYRRMYERKLLSCDEYTQRGLAHTVSEVSKLLLYIDKHPETIEKLAHGKKAVSDIMKESEKGR